MRILSVNLGTTKIVFDNSIWTGIERIYVNGELVSKKFSWFGTDHPFQVNENGETVRYVLTSGYNGWTCTATGRLFRNGVLIAESGCSSSSALM